MHTAMARCKCDASESYFTVSHSFELGSIKVSCQLIAELHNAMDQYNECEVSEAISLLAIL